MKNNKVLIIIGVLVLELIAVYLVGQSLFGKTSKYDQGLNQAREYAESELCSKALAEYNKVVALKDSVDLRLEIIEVYRKGLEIGEFINKYDVASNVCIAVDAYKNEPKVYESACRLFMEYNQYEDCAKILMQARDLKVTSEQLEEYLGDVRYRYEKYYSMYSNVGSLYDGHYAVEADGSYSFLNDELSPALKNTFTYASSFSEGYAFVQTVTGEGTSSSFIINSDGERQVYLNDVDNCSGVGKANDKDGNELFLISCKFVDSYKYYKLDGTEAFGEYKFAGRFRNGIAAVQENDGKWKIINGAGEYVSEKTFGDVVLNEFDECSAQGFIIAKEGDNYHLYDYKEVKQIGDFSADGAKAIVDGYFAYKSGDLWGFADTDGNILLEAKYEDAKSFSNNLGAVYGGEKWRLINPNGETVIEEAFDDVNYLSDNGICFVKNGDYWSYLKFWYVD